MSRQMPGRIVGRVVRLSFEDRPIDFTPRKWTSCTAILCCIFLLRMSVAVGAPATQQAITLSNANGPLSGVQLLVPFYEGILIEDPIASLKQAELTRFELAYPGPLSAPFVAWRYTGGDWTVLFAETLSAIPTAIDVEAGGGKLSVRLTSRLPCSVMHVKDEGGWPSMARALRRRWDIKGPSRRLADEYDRIHFYVRRWVSQKDEPALREDWPLEDLKKDLPKAPPRTLVHLYGLDPAGVDLGGRYLWYDGAEAEARQIIAANPKLGYLSWLNLRTFKTAIPRLGMSAPVTDDVRKMAKQFDGRTRDDDSYSYRALDMCPASQGWQASRLREFDKLTGLGFNVIQLDEFPIAPVWHAAACSSKEHLHRPNDFADEWDKTLTFVKELAERADRRGVLLTCEEPSAALLPYISGYLDRQFNDGIDIYGTWTKSKSIHTAPIFSTLFGDLVTPYTDADGADPARKPPARWLEAHKIGWAR